MRNLHTDTFSVPSKLLFIIVAVVSAYVLKWISWRGRIGSHGAFSN
jgi:hypothetical protein